MLPSINYDSPRELRAFLKERGMGMRKKFGQNFLVNPAVRSKLLDALELMPDDAVWEIGAGLGAMTSGLLERGARVTVFEIDPAFSRVLVEFFKFTSMEPNPAFHLVEGDVLKTWKTAIPKEKELLLFGNLPYNIAATLLADFIEKKHFFKRIVVTVQKEIAQRMAASPGTANYSSFSVLCSSVYKVKVLNTIKGSSFYPAPRVDSQGVRLDLLQSNVEKPALFYPMVRSLFSSRRKTLLNTLSSFVSSVIIKNMPAKDVAAEILRITGISGDRRAETLEISEFTALAVFLEEIVKNGQ